MKRWKVSKKEWKDWKWQMRNRITAVEQLKEVIPLSKEEEEGIKKALGKFRMAITPYYASLIDEKDANCPIRLQSVPKVDESQINPDDLKDPLGEVKDSKTKYLVHRYPDRVLFLVTDQCGMYCRHCTRRRMVGETDRHANKTELEKAVDYIKEHKEVRDVLISGGDPLTLNDNNLENIISEIKKVPHIEIIRLGTRTPVTMPQRITKDLVKMLKKYHPLYVNTHFNHPKEFTEDSEKVLAMLADAGIPLGNQTVLLKDVNDCAETMKKLMHKLLQNRVKPYYIYQCDLSEGIGHFRTSIDKGIEIIESLRGHTSGLAVPTYVIDAPGGGGKIPINPEYLLSRNGRKVVLRNFEWKTFEYTAPSHDGKACQKDCCKNAENEKCSKK